MVGDANEVFFFQGFAWHIHEASAEIWSSTLPDGDPVTPIAFFSARNIIIYFHRFSQLAKPPFGGFFLYPFIDNAANLPRFLVDLIPFGKFLIFLIFCHIQEFQNKSCIHLQTRGLPLPRTQYLHPEMASSLSYH